jgi:hemolysin activation/secretion protein
LNLNLQSNAGDVPFYQLILFGGSKRLRAKFEGEFRDNLALQGQLEWRQEVFKNWKFTAFVRLGYVADGFENLQVKNQKVGSSVGVRYKLNKKDHVNIRLDVSFGNGKVYQYITIGEAF